MTQFKTTSLADRVFEKLENDIIFGVYPRGEILTELKLVEQLGVSRTPIREAIRKLELEGLVVMVPRKGAHVAKITIQELNDVLEVRRGLEELAIMKACERITEEELKELETSARRFERLLRSGDLIELAAEDVTFHDVIYNATHNRRLIQILNNLREQMYRFRLEYLKEEASRKDLCEEHMLICRALRSRDVEAAHRFICQHIDNQQKAIESILKE